MLYRSFVLYNKANDLYNIKLGFYIYIYIYIGVGVAV